VELFACYDRREEKGGEKGEKKRRRGKAPRIQSAYLKTSPNLPGENRRGKKKRKERGSAPCFCSPLTAKKKRGGGEDRPFKKKKRGGGKAFRFLESFLYT